MRDGADNVVIVCSIENVDPMGVHTGDSVTVAPQQTLTDRQYQLLRDQAIAVIRAVGVETGGSNVQFAVNPATDEMVVIEMNPRVSRSSALASKATGFPIAKIAARLAVGYRLDEIPNDITRAHAGVVRAGRRLRGREVAAVRVREVPGRRRRALDAHEVGRRGDGDRAHVPAGVREGDALARARRRRPTLGRRRAARPARAPVGRPLRRDPRAAAPRGRPRRRSARAPAIDLVVPAPAARCAATRRVRGRAHATARSTPARPSSRPRRRTSTRPGSGRRCAPRSSAATGRA